MITPSTTYQTPMFLVEQVLNRLLGHGYTVTQEVSHDQSYSSPALPQKIEYLTICRWGTFVAYVFRGYSDPNTFHFVASHYLWGEHYTRTYAWDIINDGVREVEYIRWWLEHDNG